MFENKINKISNLIWKIKTDITIPLISEFLDWFYKKLDLHFIKNELKHPFKKGDLIFVSLWKNIWSELNKRRPCLVYSVKKANFWNTIVIIPIKSFNWKINDFNVIIEPNNENNLIKKSIVDLSSIRQISKKRINKKFWVINNEILKNIDEKIINFFWIKK